jgi:hypothetical protein
MATNYFAQFVLNLAKEKEAGIGDLISERAALKAKILKIDDEIAAAKKAVSRASAYPATWPRSKCPVCWLNNKDELVRAIAGVTAQCDYYRCTACDQEFEVPFSPNAGGGGVSI